MLNGRLDMRKVLIVGGTGVLSSAVTIEALRQGVEVTMINRGRRLSKVPFGVKVVISDKDNHPLIEQKLRGLHFDAVIDFLCYNEQELERSFLFYAAYTEQYFFISSAAVYNNSIPGSCQEDHPKVQPLWNYSVKKWKSEEKLMELAKQRGISYTVVRPMVTYDDTRIPYGIAPLYGFHWTLVERILHNKPIITWNNGENRCNMMRVEDFAVGLVGLIGNEKAYNEAFNICGDETPSYREILDIISEWLDYEVKTIDVDPEFYAQENPGIAGELLGGRAITTVIDNAKIKSVVPAFRQTISIREGIRRTLEAYKSKGYQKGIDWSFEALTDKTIYQWCRKTGMKSQQYLLSFVDYLSNATSKDRYNYWLRKNSDQWLVANYLKADLWLRQSLSRFLK